MKLEEFLDLTDLGLTDLGLTNRTKPRSKKCYPAPVADLLQTLAARMLKQAHAMAGMFKLVDIGPDLSLPAFFMGGRFATGGATSVQCDGE